MTGWRNDAGSPVKELEGADLDLAVARGAAYYGWVRHGHGIRIRGGTARAYYVGVEPAMPAVPGFEPPVKALCVAPFGMEEGSKADVPPQEFALVVGEPTVFRFFASSVRREDRVGDMIDDAARSEEFEEVAPIETTLSGESGKLVPVNLQAAVTEVGTLELRCLEKRRTRPVEARTERARRKRNEAAKGTIHIGAMSDFLVGIDLGTSNCAVAYIDRSRGPDAPVLDFPIIQAIRPADVRPAPFFRRQFISSIPTSFRPEAYALPWDPVPPLIVGEFARWQGARVPSRLITSAKSWLSHSGVDRTAAILPWGAPPDVEKMSPVDASSRLLLHIRNAWNQAHPEAPLETLEVVITVPASFDEIARALTVTAARHAGFEKFTLVEEPQAAFYDFTARHRHDLASGSRRCVAGSRGRCRRRDFRLHAGRSRRRPNAAPHCGRRSSHAGRRQYGCGDRAQSRRADDGRRTQTHSDAMERTRPGEPRSQRIAAVGESRRTATISRSSPKAAD